MPPSIRPITLRSAACRATVVAGLAALLLGPAGAPAVAAPVAKLQAIGVENEYADVLRQVGGTLVDAQALETDPNTDPHTFEASPRVASALANATIVVENGVGYDAWADKLLGAASSAHRLVINVQHLLGLPDSTPNPHLWYDPRTMPAVADAIARALSTVRPADAAVFRANAARFDASLRPWTDAIASFRAAYGGTKVADTEPVAGYMLEAAGCVVVTPSSLQNAIMNGTDPSPQDVTRQNAALGGHDARVLVYNQQVTDSLTQSFLSRARRNGIPVVGVYETMPTPGFDYQTWMIAEVAALRAAVAHGISTETLLKR